MYDLRIGSVDSPDAAIEVNLATDRDRLEALKLAPSEGAVPVPGVSGLWMITVSPSARQQDLRERLAPILADLEERYPDDWLMDADRTVSASDHARLVKLKVIGARRSINANEGRIAILLPAMGGIVDRAGIALSQWIGEFLLGVPDVLRKLTVPSRERHAFIPVVPGGASWEVESFLLDFPLRGEEPAAPPQAAPILPDPVTHVWVTSTGGRKGWRWDGSQWRAFQAAGVPIDEREIR
jgi:hypothetical protein